MYSKKRTHRQGRCIFCRCTAVEPDKPRFALFSSLKITLIYFAAGALWIFVTDYLAKAFFNSLTDVMIVSMIKGSVFVLLTAMLIFHLVYTALKRLVASNEQVKKSEEALLYAHNLAQLGSFEYDLESGRFSMTDKGLEMLGIQADAFSGKQSDILTCFLPEDRELFLRYEQQAIASGDIVHFDCRILLPDEEIRHLNIQFEPVFDKNGACLRILGTNQDITQRKKITEALCESERSKAVLLSHLPGIAYRCLYDTTWTMKYISAGCLELTGYQPEDFIDNRVLSYNQLICPEYRADVWEKSMAAISAHTSFRYEYQITTACKERKWVLEMGRAIYDDAGQVEALEGIIINVTESMERYYRIKYMNDHDLMTDLYNRRYYEDAKRELDVAENLPLSIILADINGVRLVNDTFGRDEGDRLIINTSNIMRGCSRSQDVLARSDGGEFALLMPNTDEDAAYRTLLAIKAACENHNSSLSDQTKAISVSVGFGVKHTVNTPMSDAEREAESFMNMRKLLDQKSHHSAVLSYIMATMYERSFETEEHALRIARVCRMIGLRMNLSQKDLDELQLFAMLHDIGKIGIDDCILKKPDKLTPKEWPEMKKHSDIGYRIAMSSVEFASVADCILTHHERWDGTGYPQALAGEDIPLLSRILAIADAYDAMTQDRIYRKAMTHEEAVGEISRNAGTQFDPTIVSIFLACAMNLGTMSHRDA